MSKESTIQIIKDEINKINNKSVKDFEKIEYYKSRIKAIRKRSKN